MAGGFSHNFPFLLPPLPARNDKDRFAKVSGSVVGRRLTCAGVGLVNWWVWGMQRGDISGSIKCSDPHKHSFR